MGKKSKKAAVKTPEVKKPKQAPVQQAAEADYDVRDALMPELEALVKKNPNRLIGCGG